MQPLICLPRTLSMPSLPVHIRTDYLHCTTLRSLLVALFMICVMQGNASAQRAAPAGQGQASPTAAFIAASSAISVEEESIDGDGVMMVADEAVVMPKREIDLPSIADGLLVTVDVVVGQSVDAKAFIAKLDDRHLRNQLRTLILDRDAADEEANNDIDIRYAEAALAESKAELDASKGIDSRSPGSVNEATMRRLRLAVQRAQLETDRAKRQQRLAQLRLLARQAEVTAIDDELKARSMLSPVAGVITEVMRDGGEWVHAGQTIVRVAQIDQLRVDALLSVDQLDPAQAVGLPVTVRWERQGKSYVLRGQVTSVDQEVFGGSRFRVHAEIENRREDGQWQLLPGWPIELRLAVAGHVAQSSDTRR
jgi:HlyD family secretion protein